MKRIVLLCSAGASTSMLMKKMLEAAASEGFDCSVEAHPINDIKEYADADCILLGPQVRFQLEKVKPQVSCPIEVIDMSSYGTMNGSAVLAQARKLMGE